MLYQGDIFWAHSLGPLASKDIGQAIPREAETAASEVLGRNHPVVGEGRAANQRLFPIMILKCALPV